MVALNINANNSHLNSKLTDSHLLFLVSCLGRRSQVRRRASSAACPRVVGRWWMGPWAPARSMAGSRRVDAPAAGGYLDARVHHMFEMQLADADMAIDVL